MPNEAHALRKQYCDGDESHLLLAQRNPRSGRIEMVPAQDYGSRNQESDKVDPAMPKRPQFAWGSHSILRRRPLRFNGTPTKKVLQVLTILAASRDPARSELRPWWLQHAGLP
jgi:hypothetical protein